MTNTFDPSITRLVLIQFHRFKGGDRQVWRNYFLAWLRHGYRPVFWSNLNCGTHGLPALPYVRGVETARLYAAPGQPSQLPAELRELWRQRALAQQAAYGRPERSFDAERTLEVHEAVFRALQPALYVNFSGGDLYCGSARAVAQQLGIPTVVTEKGLMGPTKLVDTGGTMGLSHLCDLSLTDLSKASPQAQLETRGAAYLPEWLRGFVPRAAGTPLPASATTLPAADGRTRILVLGSLDRCTGFSYPGDFKERSLPGYADGFSIALEAAHRTEGLVVYKPHPNEDAKASWGSPPANLIISSIDVRKAVDWADVVIGYGSGVDLLPIALGKPLVLAGRTFLSNKGIGIDALAPEALAGAIQQARASRDLAQRQARLNVFVGYLLDHYLYNDEPTGPARRNFTESVDDILALTKLPRFQGRPASRAHAFARIGSVLTGAGRARLEELRREDRYQRTALPVPQALAALRLELTRHPASKIVVLDTFGLVSLEAIQRSAKEILSSDPAFRLARKLRQPNQPITRGEYQLGRLLPWIVRPFWAASRSIIEPLAACIDDATKAGAAVSLLDAAGVPGKPQKKWSPLLLARRTLHASAGGSSTGQMPRPIQPQGPPVIVLARPGMLLKFGLPAVRRIAFVPAG